MTIKDREQAETFLLVEGVLGYVSIFHEKTPTTHGWDSIWKLIKSLHFCHFTLLGFVSVVSHL